MHLPRTFKCRVLTPQILSVMDESLSNDELTARKLKACLCEQFTDLPDVSLSTIKDI